VTHEQLKQILSYDPVTGVFIRLKSRSVRWIGKRAGSINALGYRIIRIGKRDHLAHRLAWFYMTGELPVDLIDHADGNQDNNVFANLREASKSTNGANRGKQANNTTGFKGVKKRYHRWIAQIHKGGQNTYLGSFESKELASAAYMAAAAQEYGEFAHE
jgi:hypothetical protein